MRIAEAGLENSPLRGLKPIEIVFSTLLLLSVMLALQRISDQGMIFLRFPSEAGVQRPAAWILLPSLLGTEAAYFRPIADFRAPRLSHTAPALTV